MSSETRVYVGTYTEAIRFGTGEVFQGKGEGIHIFRLNRDTGALEQIGVARGVKNPSFLCLSPDARFLYSVNELKTDDGRDGGMVSAFSVDPATGSLEFLNTQPTKGGDPCHVTMDAHGAHVIVANYTGGSIAVYPVESDGRLGTASSFVQHEGSSVNKNRQAGPHAHSGVLDAENKFLHVPDLGQDRVVCYRYDKATGRISEEASASLSSDPGAGPRHLVFSPDGKFAYVINELNSTITVCTHEQSSGTMRSIESVSTLPPGFEGESSCADIHMHPTGRYLYASNRGHDSIAIYRRDASSGALEPIGHEPTQGLTPRNFVLDREGGLMLVANQSSDNIVPFTIDGSTGLLHPTGTTNRVGTPVCVKIVEV